jgi:hypothetical protein
MRMPAPITTQSAGHVLQGHGDAGVDFLSGHAERQHGVGEIDGLRLLTDEQDARHPTLPRIARQPCRNDRSPQEN